MPSWKRDIFVNAIRTLMIQENKTAEEVIVRYTKLTEEEKKEILAEINKQ
jgi:hypothetical protein